MQCHVMNDYKVLKRGLTNVRVAKLSFLFFVLNLVVIQIDPVSKGSDSVVSIEPYFDFPSSDSDNTMLGFGFFKNGFGLQDASTSCTFNSIFPVGGNINLRGGQLYLKNDFLMQNLGTLAIPGTILANNYMIDFAESITGIPSTYDTVFKDSRVFLNSDLRISGTVKFKGDCLLDGRWNRLIFDNKAHIIIDKGSRLHFRNLELDGVRSFNLECIDDAGVLELDNIRWVQTGDYTFTQGSLVIQNQVNFVGPHAFYYESSQTSTIQSDSAWFFSDLTKLAIGRKSAFSEREPLYFVDRSSWLRMDDSILSVLPNGMKMTRGTFLIDGEVKVDAQSTSTANGLVWGDGTRENDLEIKIYPGAALNLYKGHLTYDIVGAKNFLSGDVEKKFVRQGSETTFYGKNNVYFSNIEVKILPTGITDLTPDKYMYFNNCLIRLPTADFVLTATRQDLFTYLLAGNGLLDLKKGQYPLNTVVRNKNNLFKGSSDVSGSVILKNHDAELNLEVGGEFLKNIVINGGTINLNGDCNLGKEVVLSGSGTVNLSKYNFNTGTKDIVWTSTIFWDSNAAQIRLHSNMTLASQLTFSGVCTIDGSGAELKLASGAELVIAKNSQLKLKNVFISGLSGNKLRCIDDSASIIFDNDYIFLDGDYSFTRGSISVVNDLVMYGDAKFSYESGLTSTIQENATWAVTDGSILKIGRRDSYYSREPLYFENKFATLLLSNATFNVTSSGLRITRGTFSVDGEGVFDVQSTQSSGGFIVGNHNADDDPICRMLPSCTVKVPKGHLVFEGINPTVFESKSKFARLVLGSGFNLHAYEDILLKSLTIDFIPGWKLVLGSGKSVTYNDMTFALPGISYEITGKRYDSLTNLLDGNSQIVVTTGGLPLYTRVKGSNNSILGVGLIGAPVTLQDSNTVLNLGVGAVAANVALNGGKIIAARPILMAEDVVFTGSGTVNLLNRYINLGGQNLKWTSTVTWDGSGGIMILRSNVYLTSKWTFSGNCTLYGDGNRVQFGPTGQIEVERGSTLVFRNVKLDGVLDGQVVCADDAAKIVFDSVGWTQDSNYTFDKGKFDIVNKMSITGPDTVFTYNSGQRSYIRDRSTLNLNQDITFAYDPQTSDRDLVKLDGPKSRIVMNSASLSSTATGLQLTKGFLEIHGVCGVWSDATIQEEGIVFGDGITQGNDLNIDIHPESNLNLQSGYIRYKNLT